jgi:predicted outer membrane repeat protein
MLICLLPSRFYRIILSRLGRAGWFAGFPPGPSRLAPSAASATRRRNDTTPPGTRSGASMRFGRRTAILLIAVMTAGAGVVLSSGPATATTVSDEASFRSAWTNPNEQQIDLAADVTLTCGGGGQAVRNSSTALTVGGNGHTIRQTCAGQRVLQQIGSGAITLDQVTITGGTTPAGVNGGGIQAPGGGTVTVTNSTVSGNTAGGNGGGVAAAGAVTLTNSTISGNTAGVNGGGVGANGVITVTNSTISSNSASTGGGVAASAAVTITNSTFSSNAASSIGSGGGIAGTSVPVAATNSTFSNNTAGLFGGGISTGGRVTLVYATLAANSAPTGSNVRLFGTGAANLTSFGSVVGLGNCALNGTATTSNGFNFSSDSSCGFTNAAQGDQQNGGDPLLGTLSDNGGPTQTRLPQAGSPLVDAIPPGSCQADGAAGITTDQRGLTRPQGAGCDIGSVDVEAQPLPNRPPQLHTAAADANGTEGDNLSTSGSFTDPDGDPLAITANNAAGTFTDNGGGTWTWSLAANDDVAATTVTVTATDPDGASTTDSFAYSAGNAAPTVAAPTVTPTGACSATLSAAFGDVGTGDTHTGLISWGDTSSDAATINENSGAGTANGAHVYASAGTYTVSLTVTDDDGGSGSNSGSFTTLNTPSGILPPINADGTSNFKLGGTIPVKITVKDCDGNFVSTLAPTVSLTKTGLSSGEVNEIVSSTAADSGNTMRWDATANQYVFNLSTRRSQFNGGSDLTVGHYVLTISDPSFVYNAVAEFDIKA